MYVALDMSLMVSIYTQLCLAIRLMPITLENSVDFAYENAKGVS